MAEHSGNNPPTEQRAFPYAAVIVSAAVLITIGAILIKLGAGGSLPKGFGIGDDLPESKVGGADLDLVRGGIVVGILVGLAVVSTIVLTILRRRRT